MRVRGAAALVVALLAALPGCGGFHEEAAPLQMEEGWTDDRANVEPAAGRTDRPHHHRGHVHGSDTCTCAHARVVNGWCGRCGLGYVAGVEISSEVLFEEIDAHGHDIDPAAVTCSSCCDALATDGFCEGCQWGFVDEQLYFSELTYALARGRPTDRDRLICRVCRQDERSIMWCDACGAGRVGSFVFSVRDDFDRASLQFEKLQHALRVAERCEMCAVVMFTGGECPACRPPRRDPS